MALIINISLRSATALPSNHRALRNIHAPYHTIPYHTIPYRLWDICDIHTYMLFVDTHHIHVYHMSVTYTHMHGIDAYVDHTSELSHLSEVKHFA